MPGWSLNLRWSVVLLAAAGWVMLSVDGFQPPLGVLLADEKAAADEKDGEPAEKSKEQKQKDEKEYYELLKLFADTLDQVERNYVKDVSRRELLEAAIDGMLTKLDQYSDYIPPAEIERFRSGVENEFGGIGVRISAENGGLTVSSPLHGTPAYRAGLAAGDRITKIDGQPTRGITINEAVKRLKGRAGEEVELTIFHPLRGKTETVTIKREVIHVATVLGDRRADDNQWSFMYDGEEKLAYIRITGFGRRTAKELRVVLEQLAKQNMRGCILDLRFNPGGLLSSAIEISDLFISQGRIVSTSGRNIEGQTWDAESQGAFEGFPMAVLVNHYSASASEIVAACLKDNLRAVVIGQRTWGKGSVQNIVELESGRSALKITTAGYLRPNGKNIHRAKGAGEDEEWGVRPSEGYQVILSSDELASYLDYRRKRDVLRRAGDQTSENPFVDRPLEKALAYLRGELAKENEDAPQGEPSK